MSDVMYWSEMESPIGPLVLLATDTGLCHIDFGSYAAREAPLRQWADRWRPDGGAPWAAEPEHPVIREATGELKRYFAGELEVFSVKLDLRGTPFQTRVWQALLDVPFGEVRSYKHIAEAIGQPKAVRAVGGANNRNPLPLIVPCHRIIGASGELVGYGGGMEIKTFLLQLERPDGKG